MSLDTKRSLQARQHNTHSSKNFMTANPFWKFWEALLLGGGILCVGRVAPLRLCGQFDHLILTISRVSNWLGDNTADGLLRLKAWQYKHAYTPFNLCRVNHTLNCSFWPVYCSSKLEDISLGYLLHYRFTQSRLTVMWWVEALDLIHKNGKLEGCTSCGGVNQPQLKEWNHRINYS